jgi:hypothetical protein
MDFKKVAERLGITIQEFKKGTVPFVPQPSPVYKKKSKKKKFKVDTEILKPENVEEAIEKLKESFGKREPIYYFGRETLIDEINVECGHFRTEYNFKLNNGDFFTITLRTI